MRSCTDRRSIHIREPKLPVARRKIAGILCVFQDFSTRPAAILAVKLGAEAIGTASKDIHGENIPFEDKNQLDVELQRDIISDEITAFLVYCNDRPYEVNEQVYNAVAELINKF